uniref:Uncharacterized protein n=1 Tax=Octactis speculum TaxID=3111310 RepID=A0A7S2GSJ3_9STRA|mmetsp:Transcript_56341/g.76839  ORF Transcript_56341/g.76839 Transcript_56341/m.76839 type:complete len:200 (+) Transcript_56341:2-601(+)
MAILDSFITHMLVKMPVLGFDVRNAMLLVNGGLEIAINWLPLKFQDRFRASSREEVVRECLPRIIGSVIDPVRNAGGQAFWRLSTQLCCINLERRPYHARSEADARNCTNRKGDTMAEVEGWLVKTNRDVERLLELDSRKHEANGKVGILDTWTMTPDEKCDMYEDWVHHPLLAFEQIEEWMVNGLNCPCSGVAFPGGD